VTFVTRSSVHTKLPWVSLLVLGSAALACSAEPETARTSDASTSTICERDGIVYAPGDPVPSGDTCNRCGCNQTRGIMCTAMACSCTHLGRSYPPGGSFPAEDGCNTCTCDVRGFVSCTEIACIPDAGASDGAAPFDASRDASFGD
jgi:hypothetical protein